MKQIWYLIFKTSGFHQMSLLETKRLEADNVSNKGDAPSKICAAKKQETIFNMKSHPVARILPSETSQTTSCQPEQWTLFQCLVGNETFLLLPSPFILLQLSQTRETTTQTQDLPIHDEAHAREMWI